VQHNHDIHFLARDQGWLAAGIESLQTGTYTPRPIKRYHIKGEVVDQLYIPDSVLQHVLLRQLKPTFSHSLNPNCFHMMGPTGVKHATQRIREALADIQPEYVLRADIRSYYASIVHRQLIQDVQNL